VLLLIIASTAVYAETDATDIEEVTGVVEADEAAMIDVTDAEVDEDEAEDEVEDEVEDEEADEAEAEDEDADEEADEAEEEESDEADAESFIEDTPIDGSCLRSFDGKKFAEKAIEYQVKYAAAGVKYSQPFRKFGLPPPKYSDCSAFTYSVMADPALNYACLWADPTMRNTRSMKPIMVDKGNFHPTPKQGDLAFWGGHVGIVVNVQCNAPAQVDAVLMGNHGCARTGCITVQALEKWGSGGWLGFWTPHY